LQDRPRILILEDKPNWREALVCLLQDEYEITLSKTYEEAVGKVQSNDFDLIILDIKLDDNAPYIVHGIQFLHMMNKNHADIPVVILTGYQDDVDQQKIFEYGNLAGFLLKVPFDVNEFKNKITEVINRKLLG
jgi:CheY-like chemotaxis protein